MLGECSTQTKRIGENSVLIGSRFKVCPLPCVFGMRDSSSVSSKMWMVNVWAARDIDCLVMRKPTIVLGVSTGSWDLALLVSF